MKFSIKHEIKGRIRVHMNQKRMTFRQADILQYYLTSQKEVTLVKVYEKNQDAVICYTGKREAVISALQHFHYETAQVPENFLENSGREIYQYQYATLTLYFANEAGDHLVKETRRVPYSTNIPLERVVVEQLMKGPKEDGHYAVLPDTMNVLSVTTSDRIAYVNFDKSFKDSALSSVAEQIPIYAVVDSITANCKVDKVQFSINGESDVTFRETMKLNQFYEEDLSYLEEKDT